MTSAQDLPAHLSTAHTTLHTSIRSALALGMTRCPLPEDVSGDALGPPVDHVAAAGSCAFHQRLGVWITPGTTRLEPTGKVVSVACLLEHVAPPPPDDPELLAAILRGMAAHAARSTSKAYEAALEGGWDPGDELMSAASRLLEHAWATRTRTEPRRAAAAGPAAGPLEAAYRAGWNDRHHELDFGTSRPAPTGDEPAPQAQLAIERLDMAREALVATGYFTADQVGDDVAPRITELFSACRDQLDARAPKPGTELADFGVDGHRHDCTATRASSLMAIKCDCAADLFAIAQDAEAAALESHAECAAVTAAAAEGRFPLTDDGARKLSVDVAQAAATAAGVLLGEDITGVRQAVQRVLADVGVIGRVHWSHPTANLPACMVAGSWWPAAVYQGPVECQATREHGEVTCRECMDHLPVSGEPHPFEASDPEEDGDAADTCRQCGELQGDHVLAESPRWPTPSDMAAENNALAAEGLRRLVEGTTLDPGCGECGHSTDSHAWGAAKQLGPCMARAGDSEEVCSCNAWTAVDLPLHQRIHYVYDSKPPSKGGSRRPCSCSRTADHLEPHLHRLEQRPDGSWSACCPGTYPPAEWDAAGNAVPAKPACGAKSPALIPGDAVPGVCGKDAGHVAAGDRDHAVHPAGANTLTWQAQRFYRDGQTIRSGGVSGPIAAMCATPDLAEELVALWNRHA